MSDGNELEYVDTTVDAPVDKKSINEIAQEVLNGEWGIGQDQRLRLAEAGYNTTEVRKETTRLRNNL